jgi:hypothetical protein
MNDKQELLVEMYRGFNAREIDKVLAKLHPDVDWPNGMEGGRVYGHEAVRSYWQRQWGVIDPRVEPVGFEEDGEQVTVNVHQVVRTLSADILMDQMVQHVYRFREGLIERMDIR